MCHFITAVLPATKPSREFMELVAKHQLLFEPLHNPSVVAQLSPGEGYFRATGHMCDCGTGLGAGSREDERSNLDRRVAKLRKKGWGEAKISRWLDQQAANKRSLAHKRASGNETPTAEAWARFLAEAVSSGAADRVGLLLHWYSGSLEEEDIQPIRREAIPLSQLSGERLLQLEEDVVYEMRRHAA